MLKWFRRVVLFAVVLLTLPRAVVFGAGFYGLLFPPAVPLVLYLASDQVVPDQVIHAPQAAIEALYNQFSAERSFAAFAADTKGHWAFTGARHSPEVARAQALARCGRDCVVMFEQRPRFYRDDLPGQTVSLEASVGIVKVLAGKTKSFDVFYALGEDGSWAVQTAADGGLLPQWAVLNRCRATLEVRRQDWPDGVAWPQCRIFHGTVTVIGPGGIEARHAAEPQV